MTRTDRNRSLAIEREHIFVQTLLDTTRHIVAFPGQTDTEIYGTDARRLKTLLATPCRITPEELLALATEEGVELTDEQLQQVSGGDTWDMVTRNPFGGRCPNCLSNKIMLVELDGGQNGFRCRDCYTEWS